MESPEYIRLSLAAAMTLGLTPGLFFRNAQLRCINLLLTYDSGCRANCAFCGLSRSTKENVGDKTFIRVAWKCRPVAEIIERLQDPPAHVERLCISMITHPRAKKDVLELTGLVRGKTGLPVSQLITPTLLDRADLVAMKDAGADRIGVAVDAATPEIFDRLRGRGVNGPHKWDHYWNIYEAALEIFGMGMAGVHLIVGLGETELEMVRTMNRARVMGGTTHLFSFFPEAGSAMAENKPPEVGHYRRIQAARYLIDHDLTRLEQITFNDQGRILDFGVDQTCLEQLLKDGEAFETSGCPGASGRTACNRPFGNERPGPDLRNFPFRLEPDDLAKVRRQLGE
ncbi:MAG: radical SAM protein [Deltaproteobacteria bacterium]|nr:radical SAM protein [Deltaproteobacteria bacterium]